MFIGNVKKKIPWYLSFFFFKRMPNFLLSRTALDLITGEIHQPAPVTGWVIQRFISLQLNISVFISSHFVHEVLEKLFKSLQNK